MHGSHLLLASLALQADLGRRGVEQRVSDKRRRAQLQPHALTCRRRRLSRYAVRAARRACALIECSPAARCAQRAA